MSQAVAGKLAGRVEVVLTTGARHAAEAAYHPGHGTISLYNQAVEDKCGALAYDLLTPG